MNELVSRHLKKRVITEKHAKHNPGSRGSQHDRTENWCVQVSRDFLERKDDRSERGVEGGGDRCGSANRQQGFDPFPAEAELPAEDRSDPGTNLHRRAFAPKRNSASERCRSTKEFSEDSANRDSTAMCEKRRLGLWNSAATSMRNVAI